MTTQADNIMCTVAWVHPPLQQGQVLAEVGAYIAMGGWLRKEGKLRSGCGPVRVLAVMKEKQTDLTVTNEPSPLLQLPLLCL